MYNINIDISLFMNLIELNNYLSNAVCKDSIDMDDLFRVTLGYTDQKLPDLEFIPLFEFDSFGNVIITEIEQSQFSNLGKRSKSSILKFLIFYRYEHINGEDRIFYGNKLLYTYFAGRRSCSHYDIHSLKYCIKMTGSDLWVSYIESYVNLELTIHNSSIISARYNNMNFINNNIILNDCIICSIAVIKYLEITGRDDIYIIEDHSFPIFTFIKRELSEFLKSDDIFLNYNSETLKLIKHESINLSSLINEDIVLIIITIDNNKYGFYSYSQKMISRYSILI